MTEAADEPQAGPPTLAQRMREHAGDQQHLYGHVMRAMADDLESGGPVREICAGWESAPRGAVVQLRLLAGLFRIVLTGRAPHLEQFYPCLGGIADPADAWPAVRGVLAANVAELREALVVAPQTNEVGRANALLVGVFAAVERTGLSQVRLLEPGASAGLNLLVDMFRFINHGWSFGPEDSNVVLANAIIGQVQPRPFEVVERRGCDLEPLDISKPESRLRLKSFVWPFHVERHERLACALALALSLDFPPQVDRAPAGEWLSQRLSEPVADGQLTVVWHSITRMYWPPAEIEAVEAAVRDAANRIPLAHVSMEYTAIATDGRPTVTLAWSPDGDEPLRTERLGTVGDHGFPMQVARLVV